jgi:hypothetical protein
LAVRVEEPARRPCSGPNTNNVVSNYPRTSTYERTSVADTENNDGRMSALYTEGHPRTQTNKLRRGTDHLGVREGLDGRDATDRTVTDTIRMASAPQLEIWPPKRRRAILWTLAQTVLFRSQQQRNLTLQDFQDFLRRSSWKLSRSGKENERVGTYLTALDS